MHLPFCDVKCAYCDFFSIAARHVDDAYWRTYCDRLTRDIETQLKLLQQDTAQPVLASIFFGGGTPSRAPVFLIQQVIGRVMQAFERRLGSVEVTAEANPESLTDEILHGWLGAGVNRISVGMQSLDESVLKYLGRLYNPHAYASVLRRAVAAGFSNISVDFITGVPGQTVRSTISDLAFAIAANVTHLSLYQLTVEPGTLLKQRIVSGKLSRPSDSRQMWQMGAAIKYLENCGYARYEISNFAKYGHRCLHNRIYWTGRPYLGLGVAAHMYTGRRRFFHPRSIDTYLARDNGPSEDQTIGRRDNLINMLRLKQNIPIGRILRLFEHAVQPAVITEINAAAQQGWLIRTGRCISMTHAGLQQGDSLLARMWNL